MNPTLQPAASSALWASLLALDLDGGAALSFSKRLARDNNWPLAFAQRTVLEYKRFVYLAATCGHPVTPSDEVDQAWHLHLVYTRSYWDELCDGILGFRLHHGPTKGGAAEGQKFGDWYARTLASYRAAFGQEPPPDVWPPAAVRFGDAPYFRRVNLRRHWLLPRPRWPRPAWRRLAGRWPWLGLVALLALAGCTARTPLNPFNWYGPEFLGLFWGLLLTTYPLALWARHRGREYAEDYLGSLPDPYELARLADAGRLVADAALAALHQAGRLTLLPGRKLAVSNGTTAPAHPYERAVWALVAAHPQAAVDTIRQQALDPQRLPALAQLDATLERHGLLLPAARQQALNRIPNLAAGALALFGLAKVAVGLSRDRPVGLLLLSLVGLAVGHYFCQHYFGAWATGRGAAVLRRAGQQVRQQRQAGSLTPPLLVMSVALFGVAELRAVGMAPLADTLLPPNTSSGDAGGSGCGGSGCGGGGCGGCGS